MPELATADGRPLNVAADSPEAVNAAFSEAMNSDPGDAGQAPPKRQPKPAEPEQGKRGPGRPKKEDKSRTTAAAPVAALSDRARSEGVKGIAQIGAGIAMMIGKATKTEAFEADAVVIVSNAEQFADACIQTAHADAAFAARLDKLCAVGPYGALIAVGVGVATQCARNHRPGLNIPGTVDPRELLAAAGAQNEPAAA
jgi:hypothetical protein